MCLQFVVEYFESDGTGVACLLQRIQDRLDRKVSSAGQETTMPRRGDEVLMDDAISEIGKLDQIYPVHRDAVQVARVTTARENVERVDHDTDVWLVQAFHALPGCR